MKSTLKPGRYTMRIDGWSSDGKYRISVIESSNGKKDVGRTFTFPLPMRYTGLLGPTMTKTTLYIGNFPYETTEHDLRQLLDGYTVQRVTIITEKDTGRPKGFGFVDLEPGTNVDGIIEQFDGCDFGGRRLKVARAVQKPRERNGKRRSYDD